jgi:hypothetical protein
VTAPTPRELTAAAEAAAMDQPEFDVLGQVTAAVLRKLTTLWVRLFGGVRVLPSNVVAGALTGPTRVRPAPTQPATPDFPPEWTDAVDEGLAEIIDAMDAAADSVHREVPAARTDRAAAYRRERARAAAAPSRMAKRGFAAVQEALAQPALLTQDVRTAVVDTLVLEHTEAQRAEARRRGPGWGLIWVCERDACVRCLAYAGLYGGPDEEFPGGLTFGPEWPSVVEAPAGWGPGLSTVTGSDGIPLGFPHPRCRCEVQVIRLADAAPMADALKREARRSAAKGWALESESDSVRTAAARKLLDGNANLPQSVVTETRRRLRAGREFKRRVPSGHS